MSDKSSNGLSHEDAILNKLIRASREEPMNKFVRPDENIITAYLMGTATDEQEKEVKSALLQSKAFRREVLDMAEDMDVLEDIELLADKKKLDEIEVPNRQDFLARYEKRTVAGVESISFWAKLKKYRIPQLYAPALAAAAVLVLLILGPYSYLLRKTQPSQWSVVMKNIDPGMLVSNVTREATETELPKSYSTADSAALAEFRFLLRYESGQFHLNPVEIRHEPITPYSITILQFADETGNIIKNFQVNIPLKDGGKTDVVEAWVLTIPSKNLYRLEMPSDTVKVIWPEDMESKGCITFTYLDDEGYRAVIGYTFDFLKSK